jgi:hypothetical protein
MFEMAIIINFPKNVVLAIQMVTDTYVHRI